MIIHTILNRFLPIIQLSPSEFERLHSDSSKPPKYGELSLERRLYALLPNKHLLAYKYLVSDSSSRGNSIEPVLRTHLVLDYLAGMTDSHALRTYNMLNGTSEGLSI